MADFTTKSVTKSAERKTRRTYWHRSKLPGPLSRISSTTTPGAAPRTPQTVQPLQRLSGEPKHYSGKVVYENAEAKTVGQISVRAPTSAAFSTNISTIVAATAINTAMGGTPSHDSSEDTFSCALKCHNTNGEDLHGHIQT